VKGWWNQPRSNPARPGSAGRSGGRGTPAARARASESQPAGGLEPAWQAAWEVSPCNASIGRRVDFDRAGGRKAKRKRRRWHPAASARASRSPRPEACRRHVEPLQSGELERCWLRFSFRQESSPHGRKCDLAKRPAGASRLAFTPACKLDQRHHLLRLAVTSRSRWDSGLGEVGRMLVGSETLDSTRPAGPT
jgi:hypothetical protein